MNGFEELHLRLENAGNQYHGSLLRLELYRLFCYFHASKRFQEITDGSDYCPYQPLKGQFEKEEINRIMVTVAIFGRQYAHRFRKERGITISAEESKVGAVQKNIKEEDILPLGQAEACSKIIHAQHTVIDEENPTNPYESWIKPRVTLYSSPTKSEGWKAQIEIENFIGRLSDLATNYE
jgi:hypothetical protein